MQLIHRAFHGPDDWPLIAGVVHARPQDHPHVVDLPYRLCSWAFDDPANCAIWEDRNGQVMAWAALQTPFWCIDYALHPAAPPTTLPTVLAWADRRAQLLQSTPFARPIWFVNRFKGDAEQSTLEAFGFVSQADVGENSWTKVLFRKEAQQHLTKPALPDGFQIRPLNGRSEIDAYVTLHRAVFQSESMTTAWRERTLCHPAYQPDCDLVLVDPHGQLAGFCIGWYAPTGPDQQPAGQIEPMGIRADVRGRGLGKALLLDCLDRLRSAGATALFVETDSDRDAAFRLYQSVGFHVVRDVIVYRKDYRAAE